MNGAEAFALAARARGQGRGSAVGQKAERSGGAQKAIEGASAGEPSLAGFATRGSRERESRHVLAKRFIGQVCISRTREMVRESGLVHQRIAQIA